jgi:hypothetical protein
VLTEFRLNGLVRAEKPARDEASGGVKRANQC